MASTTVIRPRAPAARLERRLEDRANNFDVLRLLAATLVLVSHCYPLTGRPEPFAALSGWTMGEVGVVMFFAMSGFLIAKSWSDQPQVRAFAAKRALRLLPALIVAVLLTALVIGPVFTSLAVGQYYTDPGTWGYIVRNCLLYTVAGRLPGVFEDNVYPDAVNGSLWTLPVEAAAYVMAAALGVLGILRRSLPLLLLVGALALLASGVVPLTGTAADTTAGGNARIVAQLIAAFALGSLLFSARGRIPLSWPVLGLLTALWVLSFDSRWTVPAGVLAIGYGVLVLAFRTPGSLRAVTAPGDVSYGIYVYAFPVQQSVAAVWGAGLAPAAMAGLAFPVTYVLALLSWRLVERPALRLKRLVS